MTESSNAELIAEARERAEHRGTGSNTAQCLRELAAALEAAEQGWDADVQRLAEAYNARLAAEQRAEEAERERDRLDEAFDRDLPWRYDDVEAQRNQLAAVVEKVRERFMGPSMGLVRDVERTLTSAPTDALREVKAEAIREYVTAARENPHTYYWPPSGVLDDAEQWADEIEKGTF